MPSPSLIVETLQSKGPNDVDIEAMFSLLFRDSKTETAPVQPQIQVFVQMLKTLGLQVQETKVGRTTMYSAYTRESVHTQDVVIQSNLTDVPLAVFHFIVDLAPDLLPEQFNLTESDIKRQVVAAGLEQYRGISEGTASFFIAIDQALTKLILEAIPLESGLAAVTKPLYDGNTGRLLRTDEEGLAPIGYYSHSQLTGLPMDNLSGMCVVEKAGCIALTVSNREALFMIEYGWQQTLTAKGM